MAYNRFEIGYGASKTLGTLRGIEYVQTVLEAWGTGMDTFRSFMKARLLLIQRPKVLEKMKDIEGMEMQCANLLAEYNVRAQEQIGVAIQGINSINSTNADDPLIQEEILARAREEVNPQSRKKQSPRDEARSKISGYLRDEFNKFRLKPLLSLPSKKAWNPMLEQMGVEMVFPEGITIEDLIGSSRKRKREDELRILNEIEKLPPTLYLRRKET